MEQRKPYTYLISFALICVLMGLFAWNIFSGYFSFLDPLLSGVLAAGFAIAALSELDNLRKALKKEKEDERK